MPRPLSPAVALSPRHRRGTSQERPLPMAHGRRGEAPARERHGEGERPARVLPTFIKFNYYNFIIPGSRHVHCLAVEETIYLLQIVIDNILLRIGIDNHTMCATPKQLFNRISRYLLIHRLLIVHTRRRVCTNRYIKLLTPNFTKAGKIVDNSQSFHC